MPSPALEVPAPPSNYSPSTTPTPPASEYSEASGSTDINPLLKRSGVFKFLDSYGTVRRERREARDAKVEVDQSGTAPSPKVFFANERTFLSWMQFCLILTGLSIALINFGDRAGLVAGFMFAFISCGVMFYSLYQFWNRAEMLQRKERGAVFEDMMGILVFVAVIMLAVGVK
ncbi:hypothetical protein DFS34DRAFT_651551 [Phlyctochytrium arcticum]|nr:hypothetical protein DFS34DRAFT_651551 [Phlyctochytrium arcticum]